MKNYKKHVMSLMILILFGCAQTSDDTKNFSQTNAEIGQPNQQKAVLVLYRKSVPPLIFPFSSTVNDKEFTTLRNNTYSWSYLSPGEYELKIEWPFLAMTPGKTQNLEIEAGRYYFVEFGGDTNIAGVGSIVYGTYNFTISNHKENLLDIQNCCSFVPSRL